MLGGIYSYYAHLISTCFLTASLQYLRGISNEVPRLKPPDSLSPNLFRLIFPSQKGVVHPASCSDPKDMGLF